MLSHFIAKGLRCSVKNWAAESYKTKFKLGSVTN